MAKKSTQYCCQECGHISYQWLGRCPSCSNWNSFVEEVVEAETAATQRNQSIDKIVKNQGTKKKSLVSTLSKVTFKEEDRWTTGISELDRVLGGGVVPGAFVLIGGDPGIGKSTLLLQSLESLSQQKKVLYVTGEESTEQVKLRAERLGVSGEQILIAAETSLEKILSMVEKEQPDVLAIDSIQTMYLDSLQSAPGSVAQVREVGARLMHLAKRAGIFTVLIGHVTKDGAIAGPRVLEHMVDTVLYFDGGEASYRVLRGVKNRFGSTNEIGVFEMRAEGLKEINNPSELFLTERAESIPGSVAVSSIEGTRPILIELQALVSKSYLPTARRAVLGIDHQRASILFAVMEKKWEMSLYDQDIFVNVVGGVKLQETSVDLGIMCAVASSFFNQAIPKDCIILGEVGLADEVRPINRVESRVREAISMGFSQCILPQKNKEQLEKSGVENIELIGVRRAHEAVDFLFRK